MCGAERVNRHLEATLLASSSLPLGPSGRISIREPSLLDDPTWALIADKRVETDDFDFMATPKRFDFASLQCR